MKLIGFPLKSFELIIKHQKQNLKKEKQINAVLEKNNSNWSIM